MYLSMIPFTQLSRPRAFLFFFPTGPRAGLQKGHGHVHRDDEADGSGLGPAWCDRLRGSTFTADPRHPPFRHRAWVGGGWWRNPLGRRQCLQTNGAR